jgi:hypothetical protein
MSGAPGFEDCLQKPRTQDFGGLYFCDASGIKYMKPVGVIPNQSKEREGQNPN